MVTQILFGETFTVSNSEDKWTKVRLAYDDYEGWIDSKQFVEISKAEFDSLLEEPASIAADLVQPAVNHNNSVPIVAGSTLPAFDGINLNLGSRQFVYNGKVARSDQMPLSEELIVKFARKFLNTPYLWGGRSPLGMDCSGFTQVVFKLAGLKLPRDAYQQAEVGRKVDFIERALAGDLAFFGDEADHITHVGIMLSPTEIIHASGWVQINPIDSHGILSADRKSYTHKLRSIRRLL
jgi:hypothetical protein